MTTNISKSPARKRGMPSDVPASKAVPHQASAPTRLRQITELLQRNTGASLSELCEATGWQAHSVRGAIAGALKKKGHSISSEKVDGNRRYRIGTTE